MAVRGGVVMLGAGTARERGKEQQEKKAGRKEEEEGWQRRRGEPA